MTICGVPTTCLFDNSSAYNFIDRKILDRLGLRATVGETLEIVLVDGSKVIVDKVCHIPIQFYKQITQEVLYDVLENFSSSLILGIWWLTNTNPAIHCLEHEIDLQYGQSEVTFKGQTEKRWLPRVELFSAKAEIK